MIVNLDTPLAIYTYIIYIYIHMNHMIFESCDSQEGTLYFRSKSKFPPPHLCCRLFYKLGDTERRQVRHGKSPTLLDRWKISILWCLAFSFLRLSWEAISIPYQLLTRITAYMYEWFNMKAKLPSNFAFLQCLKTSCLEILMFCHS